MKAKIPVWRSIIEEIVQPRRGMVSHSSRPVQVPLKEDTYSTTERQGPGRAFWFEKAEDAQAFAIAKAEIGHKVIYDSYSPDYVWVSHTKKYTTEKARHVLALIDPVTPVEDEGEKDVEKPVQTPKDGARKKPVEEWAGDHLSEDDSQDTPPDEVVGPVKLSDLIRYYAKSWGGANRLYDIVIPALKRAGRLVKDVPDYPKPTLTKNPGSKIDYYKNTPTTNTTNTSRDPRGVPPENRPGSVKLSDLIAYHARSFGGAMHLYHNIIPTLQRTGRLVKDVPDYQAPTMSDSGGENIPINIKNEAQMTSTQSSQVMNQMRNTSGDSAYNQKYGSMAPVMKLADKTADVMDPAAAKAKAALKSSPLAKPGQSGKAGAMPVAIMASLDLLYKIKGRISEAIDSAGGPAKKEPTEVTAAVTPLRYQAATVIAQILGGSRISGHMAQFKQSMSSPEQMIDVALRIFLKNSHTPEAWADAGRMLELAKSMKIAWNDKVLNQRHREIMDLA